ncbi:hypothetical protein GALL_405710 [mine drainage metagenome]|uniref:Uncharacterized protein n=1 Tax=mine drainage metagenome TaxID=410659 RepID=A0A1J5QCT8_9ZZZZ
MLLKICGRGERLRRDLAEDLAEQASLWLEVEQCLPFIDGLLEEAIILLLGLHLGHLGSARVQAHGVRIPKDLRKGRHARRKPSQLFETLAGDVQTLAFAPEFFRLATKCGPRLVEIALRLRVRVHGVGMSLAQIRKRIHQRCKAMLGGQCLPLGIGIQELAAALYMGGAFHLSPACIGLRPRARRDRRAPMRLREFPFPGIESLVSDLVFLCFSALGEQRLVFILVALTLGLGLLVPTLFSR